MSDELVKRLRDQQTKWMTPLLGQAADRIESLEAAISAALERIDASMFTNAEHQQAKDILREAVK